MTASIWLFGYGSLIWRPDFAYISRQVAWVDGWSRRFWQGSHDHRGVPEAPGRVVTLIPAADEKCGGMAYEISLEQAGEIFDQLDYREKNGYERHTAPLYFDELDTVNGVFYIAAENNPAFLGPASIESIAAQIKQSSGPSGSNEEYLYELASALRQYKIEDEHVFLIETELMRLSAT